MANGPLTRRACNQYGTGGQRPSRPWSFRPRPPVTQSRSQRGEADRGAPGAGSARPVTRAARDSHFPNCALHHAAGRVRHHVGPPRRSAPTRWLRSRYERVCADWHAHAVFASVGGCAHLARFPSLYPSSAWTLRGAYSANTRLADRLRHHGRRAKAEPRRVASGVQSLGTTRGPEVAEAYQVTRHVRWRSRGGRRGTVRSKTPIGARGLCLHT
jgi:hypothetical protein